MTTLEEYLSAQTPAFRKKVKAEFRQMSLQCAVSRLRYEQNLTQQEVARKLQLSQSAVSKIERKRLGRQIVRSREIREHSWRKALAAS